MSSVSVYPCCCQAVISSKHLHVLGIYFAALNKSAQDKLKQDSIGDSVDQPDHKEPLPKSESPIESGFN
jgi:hypothetical protein